LKLGRKAIPTSHEGKGDAGLPKENRGDSYLATRLYFKGAKMRDLLFKNLTSHRKKRKIITTSEIQDKQGVHSIIHRHFVCIVKEIKDNQFKKPQPYLYVLKEHNNKDKKERFFCRLKGSLLAVNNGRLFLILYVHSLRITLTAIPQDSSKA
jgi:hypothetical protein